MQGTSTIASEAQRVHLVRSKEEHHQLKANLVKDVNDVATNDVGMKSALEGAIAELSGMVKDLKVHCDDAVVKLGQSLIRRTYLIGCRTDVKSFLDWFEQQGNNEITAADLHGSAGATMIDLDPVQCSHEL